MLNKEQISFVEQVKESITKSDVSLRKDQLEKMALQFGIADQTEAKELSEYAVVELARKIALSSKSTESKYYSIVNLYNKQPNLTHRSSKSSIYQQYSTPAPISFLAGAWCLEKETNLGSVKRGGRFTKNHFMLPKTITGGYTSKGSVPEYPYPFVFEPSAGNGLLTIAFPPQNVWANEIDPFRHSILQNQPYFRITDKDSSDFTNFLSYTNTFDYVVTNPPFDKLPKDIVFNGTEFGILDHLMVAISLELMKPNGRAALIIGGHTEYDEQGRIKAGKNRKFISYLYKHFNVVDIININGDLYKKQGTQFDIRMILIDGKSDVKTNYPPLFNQLDIEQQQTVTSFEQLYNRIFTNTQQNDMTIKTIPTYTFNNNDEVVVKKLDIEFIETINSEFYLGYIDKIESLAIVYNNKIAVDTGYATKSQFVYPEYLKNIIDKSKNLLFNIEKNYNEKIYLWYSNAFLKFIQETDLNIHYKLYEDSRKQVILNREIAKENEIIQKEKKAIEFKQKLNEDTKKNIVAFFENQKKINYKEFIDIINYYNIDLSIRTKGMLNDLSKHSHYWISTTEGTMISKNKGQSTINSIFEIVKKIKDLYTQENDMNIELLEAEAEALALELELTNTQLGMSDEKLYVQLHNGVFPCYIKDYYTGTNSNFKEMCRVVVYMGKGIKRYLEVEKDKLFKKNLSGLGMPYIPVSESCKTMNVDVPDSMAFETQSALLKMKKAIGGNVTEWLTKKLNYKTEIELCNVLFGEQIDAVANAIYNFEFKGQGIIIGDQTGIGKGRQAAAIVRYGIENGYTPVFMTEKINLFSDILRDMIDINSKDYKPFIVNAKEDKTSMKDQEGNIVYQALEKNAQNDIIKNPSKISKFDYVVCTYSQFNKNKVDENGNVELDAKGNFLLTISDKAIFILDESHNAGGESNIGRFMKMCIEKSIGTVFLSATFAKRPENMPLYAVKTALKDANMTNEEFIEAFKTGGVALQEVVSSQLVQEGQMIRRERKIENLEVNYNTLTNQAIEHSAIADRITAIIRRIIRFETEFIDGEIAKMDKIIASTQGEVQKTKGTSKAGVSNSPYFSKLFNVINQMLFSIKTNEVVEHALVRLKEGKKVVIAFSSTMEAFLSETEPGEIVNADFTEVLKRGLQNTLRYSELDAEGIATHKYISLSSLSQLAQDEYNDIMKDIRSASSGITASPIDVLKQRLSEAGYNVIEVTGRQKELRYNFTEAEAETIQEKQAAKPNKKTKAKSSYTIAEALMPPIQYQYVLDLAKNSEEKDFFIKVLDEVETKGAELKKRSLEKEDSAFRKENKNKAEVKSYYRDIALPTFHFFNGSTDIYVYEWHEQDGLLYTYTILNGDVEMSEFSYQSIEDLHKNYGFGRTFEMDFYFTPKPINEILSSSRFSGLGAVSTQKNTMALVMNRKKENVSDAFRAFQNNECDVLLINQSGSTGASAHAVTTSKVKKEEVRQRCMIFLQAELDINRQVQKMGRVNRTGQIMPPIYDYLSSVIPAEQRLMMMLQKKLKSLDANTSSNQKNSSNLLDVPDFLNKYGDKVVYDYLVNNPEINLILGDVLDMKENESEAKEPSGEKLANLSSRISGRVAVLPVKDQENFYTTIFEDYNKLVKSLQQQGKYDLEMETKNFEAETLSRDLVYINPNPGLSVFSNHSYLEKVEVNNLVKPYSQYEVKELVEKALNGVDPKEYSIDIINQMDIWADEKRANIEKEQTERFDTLIKNITQEKKYAKLVSGGASDIEKQNYIKERTQALEKGKRDAIDNERTKLANQTGTFRRYFKFFYPGKSVKFPTATFENGAAFSEAICLSIEIDFKKKNPFTPGNIYFNFAISDSNRHFDINLANEGANQIGLCVGESYDITKNYLDNWTELCGKSNANRVVRYIVTGNILQTISKANYKQGKLVNYTVKGGGVSKGLIMPNKWQPNFEMGGGKSEVNITIPVPVFMAKDFIKDYFKQNTSEPLETNNQILFLRFFDTRSYTPNYGIEIRVPRSASQGGIYFKDLELLKLVENQNFNSSGQFMRAVIREENVDKALKYLQEVFKLNLMVKKSDLDKITIPEGEIPEVQVQIPLPPAQAQRVIEEQVIDTDADELMLMELEAEALALELELLSLQGMKGYKDEYVITNGELFLSNRSGKFILTDNYNFSYSYEKDEALNQIRHAESLSKDDSKFYIKTKSEVLESLKGIGNVRLSRQEYLEYGKKYLEITSIKGFMAFIDDIKLKFPPEKYRLFYRWIGDVEQANSHRNSEETKEQSLFRLELGLKNKWHKRAYNKKSLKGIEPII